MSVLFRYYDDSDDGDDKNELSYDVKSLSFPNEIFPTLMKIKFRVESFAGGK
jgi:hypothetical protein